MKDEGGGSRSHKGYWLLDQRIGSLKREEGGERSLIEDDLES